MAVLDLTDEAVRAELALAPADLVGDGYHRTQAIAEAAVRAGFDAIRAPSAALPGGATLVVFASGVPKLTARLPGSGSPRPDWPTGSDPSDRTRRSLRLSAPTSAPLPKPVPGPSGNVVAAGTCRNVDLRAYA